MFAATYSWASHPGFPLMLSRERGWTRQTLSSRPGNDLTYSSWFVWSNSVCLKITPLMSNTRNTREANLEGSPLGKNCRENHIKFSWTNKCTTSQAICGTCSISKQLCLNKQQQQQSGKNSINNNNNLGWHENVQMTPEHDNTSRSTLLLPPCQASSVALPSKITFENSTK